MSLLLAATMALNSLPCFAGEGRGGGVCLSVQSQQAPDPMRLPIGTEVTVQPNTLTDLRLQQPATPDAIAKAADGKNWVFLGENHATKPHQQMEADIVDALLKHHRRVIVGLEMIQRPKQNVLDLWSQDKLKEPDFLSQVDWKGQWGYDYAFYRPLLETIRKHHLPLIGLNVPRDWVHSVGQKGFAGLTPEQKAELPQDMSLTNDDHKQLFTALMGGHPMTGTMGDNIYAAQVLWDEAMADTALKYLQNHPHDKNTVFVIVAGSGHSMYNQGINYRVFRRTGERGITVEMAQSDGPATVSRGVGDFVYVTAAGVK